MVIRDIRIEVMGGNNIRVRKTYKESNQIIHPKDDRYNFSENENNNMKEKILIALAKSLELEPSEVFKFEM